MKSPYQGKEESEYRAITCNLIQKHPLGEKTIVNTIVKSWNQFWLTKIGGTIDILGDGVNIPAQITSHFLEKLFAFNLSKISSKWKGGNKKTEKDIVYDNDIFSFEMKCSSSAALQVFGNRSYTYGKSLKKRSGYFLTVNFSGNRLSLIRFGWVDENDWVSQKSSSGQQARLKPYVYQHKLKVLLGEYMNNAPLTVLPGVGKKTEQVFQQQKITALSDIDLIASQSIKNNYQLKRQKFLSSIFPGCIKNEKLNFEIPKKSRMSQEKLISIYFESPSRCAEEDAAKCISVIMKQSKVSKKEAKELIVEIANINMEREAREFFEGLVGHPFPSDDFIDYAAEKICWPDVVYELVYGEVFDEECTKLSPMKLLTKEKSPGHDLVKYKRLLNYAAEKSKEDENEPSDLLVTVGGKERVIDEESKQYNLIACAGAMIGNLDHIKLAEKKGKMEAGDIFACSLATCQRTSLEYILPFYVKEISKYDKDAPEEQVVQTLDNIVEQWPNGYDDEFLQRKLDSSNHCTKEELVKTVKWLKSIM